MNQTRRFYWISMFCVSGHQDSSFKVMEIIMNALQFSTHLLNPLSPNINMYILVTVSPYVSYFTDWENLFKHQDISSLVIIAFILITCTFDQAVILLGEIRCWSLLGLKGLTLQVICYAQINSDQIPHPTPPMQTWNSPPLGRPFNQMPVTLWLWIYQCTSCLYKYLLTFILGFSIMACKLKKDGWGFLISSGFQENNLCTLKRIGIKLKNKIYVKLINRLF